jgi:murein DD-endopeptidase MepM/ murein hydrolase activator NlpD
MAKKGVLRITGNTSPKTGVKTFYKVTEWYPDTPLSERKESLVTWELFRKRENGKFTTTNIKKKVGEFTFGKDAWQYTYRVEGYVDKPEGKEPMSIIVQPQKNDKKAAPKEKDILGVKLTFQDGTPVNKKLSYKDRLWATAKCQGMEGEYITFSLWEDDEIGEGHNKKNQFILKSSPVQVDSKGYARWNFALLNTYISIANKREDDKKKHEYYVIAEYKGKLKASDNASVDDPEYKAPTPPPKKPTGSNNSEKPQSKPKPAPPKPKPDSPKGSTRTNSPNNQPDKKGEITQIKLTDINGKDFTKNPKFGETIIVHIESKNLIGKKYKLNIWEHDAIGKNDLLYNNEHTFLGDKINLSMPLTAAMHKTGEIGNDKKNPDNGEYWKGGQQEIFAEVILLNISSKSKIIDMDIMEAPKPPNNGNTASGVKDQPKPEQKSTCICQEQYKDLIWGGAVSCEFRKKVIQISKRAGIDPNNLMAAMAHETGGTFDPACGTFRKKKDETAEGYVGLLQIGKDAATDLKITRTELLAMDQIKQLDYIEKYLYLPLVRGKLNTLTDFYLAVLFPVDCGKGNQPNHIVFDNSLPISYKNGKAIKNLNYWRNVGYAANPAFHKEAKEEGKTYVWEIAENIKKWYDKGKLNKVRNLSCQNIQNIKSESPTTNKWHDPVDNPICTLYMQSGNGGKGTSGEHWGLFGKTRNGSKHQGLDLFVVPGSNVYSCVKGIVHKVKWHSGYGNTMTIKIIDKESFFNHRRDYSLLHPSNGEISQSDNFDKTKDIFLFYAHLEEVLVEENVEVAAGKVIAKSGVSGVEKGTCAPHLHFEIFSTVYAVGMGLNYRCNPGFYVHFKAPNEQSQNELNLQKETAKTRIKNLYGKK